MDLFLGLLLLAFNDSFRSCADCVGCKMTHNLFSSVDCRFLLFLGPFRSNRALSCGCCGLSTEHLGHVLDKHIHE